MPDLEPLAVLLADTDLMARAVLDAVDGLTTEDYLWEPVDGCWSVRPSPDGGHVQDWTPAPPVAPFTTIAWRMAHVGQSLAGHSRRLFQRGEFSYEGYRPAGTVDGERAFLEAGLALWREGIAGCGDDLTADVATEVLGLNHHHLGHAKEIDAIRQLLRARSAPHDDPLVAACLRGDAAAVASMFEDERTRHDGIERHPDLVLTAASMGRWDVVTTLLARGWPADTATGATALHHAAAAGGRDVVEALISHGADPHRRDPEWNATPKGWAEFFGNQRTLDALR